MATEIVISTPVMAQPKNLADVQIVTQDPIKQNVVVDTTTLRGSPRIPSAPAPSPQPSPKASPKPKPVVRTPAPLPKKAHQPKKPSVVFKTKQRPIDPNSVKGILESNPTFADEFSATIPVSPNLSRERSPTQRSPAPAYAPPKTNTKAKVKPQPKYVEEVEEDEVEEEDEDDEEYVEEDEVEEEDEVFGSKTPPTKPQPKPVQEDEDDVEESEGDVDMNEDEAQAQETEEDAQYPEVAPKSPEQVEQEEEDEIIEKMRLIEDIKEASRMGFIPPQQPNSGMPVKLLRQIKRFQDEMAMQALNVGLMGHGLVQLVGVLETLNGRFDPMAKIMGTGLKLQGAKGEVEANLDKYSVPFTKIYRNMRKKGMAGEMPPWLQITLTTVGILTAVHKKNMYEEISKNAEAELHDPESIAKARALYGRPTPPPEHTDYPSPISDAELEDKLAKEFAGFDNLPSFKSINRPSMQKEEAERAALLAEKRKEHQQQLQEQQKSSAVAAAAAAALASTATVEEKLDLVQSKPDPKKDEIDLSQSSTASDSDDAEEDFDGEGSEDVDEDEEDEEAGDSIIKIPVLRQKKN
jgi:hypothetical protein